MAVWVIAAGEPFSIHGATEDAHGFRLTGSGGRRLWRDEYGFDWLVAAYRAGAVSLLQSVVVVS